MDFFTVACVNCVYWLFQTHTYDINRHIICMSLADCLLLTSFASCYLWLIFHASCWLWKTLADSLWPRLTLIDLTQLTLKDFGWLLLPLAYSNRLRLILRDLGSFWQIFEEKCTLRDSVRIWNLLIHDFVKQRLWLTWVVSVQLQLTLNDSFQLVLPPAYSNRLWLILVNFG